MDLTKCTEILSKRQCGGDACCAEHGFNLPPRKHVAVGEADPGDQSSSLKSFDKYALVEMFIALQRDRVLEYANFMSAIQFLLDGSRLHEYPQLVAEMTSRFSVISAQIIRIKEALVECGMREWSRQIDRLQQLEREKLTVVASLHLDMIQQSRPELLQSSSVSGCEVKSDSTYAKRRVQELEAAVSEIVESLQGELCDSGSGESNPQCSAYNTVPLPLHEYKSMKLWNVLREHEDAMQRLHHKALYGFAYAIKKVYNHQHPADCKNQKFFIFPGHLGGGFGSNLHIEGLMMAVAMNMGRIYLPHPRYSYTLKWPFEYPFCTDYHEMNFNCYYETVSSCTYSDAYPQYNYSDPMSWPDDFGELVNPPLGEDQLTTSFAAEHKVVRTALGSGVQAWANNVYPAMFTELLACGQFLDIRDKNRWWNAISIAFLVRPNTRTLHQISKFHTDYPALDMRRDQPVIGMYVRHGDKGAEMKLVPLSQYLEAAQSLWDQGLAHTRYRQKVTDTNPGKPFHPTRNGTIFIGTEDPQVIVDAVEWGRVNGWKILYTEVLDRKRMDAAHLTQGGGPYDGEYRHGHHELEYHSMLFNLELLLRCAAWVGTMDSGYNQAADELRNTIAAKADLTNADLVFGKPPLLYRGFYSWEEQNKLKTGA